LSAAGCNFVFWPEPLVVWYDIAEDGRTSRASGAEHSEAFLKKNGHLLSAKARRGFRATYVAYDLAHEKPVAALADLALGATAGVPLRVIGRQLLRAYVPRPTYRRLVNTFIRIAAWKNS
jgi:hypothetical protein